MTVTGELADGPRVLPRADSAVVGRVHPHRRGPTGAARRALSRGVPEAVGHAVLHAPLFTAAGRTATGLDRVPLDHAIGPALVAGHRFLQDLAADLVLAAGVDAGRPTVAALVRSADAAASGLPVLGLVTRAGAVVVPSTPGWYLGAAPGDNEVVGVAWSGSDAEDERRVRADLLAALAEDPWQPVPAVVPVGLPPATVRAAAVATPAELRAAVRDAVAHELGPGRPVLLAVPDPASFAPGAGSSLYGHDARFTAAVDAVHALAGPAGRRALTRWLSEHDAADDDLVGLAVGVGLGQLVRGWAVEPAAVLGHGDGTVAAGVLADSLTLTDATRAAVTTGRPGAALHVPARLPLYVGDDPTEVLGAALDRGPALVVECGPAGSFGAAPEDVGTSDSETVALLDGDTSGERRTVLAAAQQLWRHGVDVRLTA